MSQKKPINLAELQYRQNFAVDELALWEGTSRSTVYREIADGRLRTVRIRGRRLIPRAEADRRAALRAAEAGLA